MSNETPDDEETLKRLHMRVFQRHLLEQFDFALVAYNSMRRANISLPRDSDGLWFAMQSLLTATANIKKALWGINDAKREARAKAREPLRRSIGVEDDSPLNDTDVRNAVDHVDERIDTWLRVSKHHFIADRSIGPPSGFDIGPREPNMFRLYDPEADIVYFWEKQFNLTAIVTEILRVRPALAIEAAKPHWKP